MDSKQDIYVGALNSFLSTLKVSGETTGPDHFATAPNIIQWVASPSYLNVPSLWSYPNEYRVLRDLFELQCPYCNTEEEPDDLRREILLEHNKCPKCHATKLDLYRDGLVSGYNELTGVLGMRSGKTVLAGAFIGTYLLHAALMMNLQEYFGLMKGQLLELAFVAASSVQAHDTAWSAFVGAFDKSPWFQGYIAHLREREKKEGLAKESLFRRNSGKIEFPEAHIQAVCLSRNSATAAGRTRIGVIVDELSRFEQTQSFISAEEVYQVHKRSLKTLQSKADQMRARGEWPAFDGIMVCISAPMFSDDKMMRLLKDAETSKKMYSIHKATWEFNPDFTEESFKDEFLQDPTRALRDYGAQPPGAMNPLVKNPEILRAALDPSRQPLLKYRLDYTTENAGGAILHYTKPILVGCPIDPRIPRVIACDPGKNHDSFGISIAHAERAPSGEIIFVLDAIIDIRPKRENTGHGMTVWEVHFPAVLAFIKLLSQRFRIQAVAYDQWNSAHLIAELQALGIRVEKVSLKRQDYFDFLDDAAQGRVRLIGRLDSTETSEDRALFELVHLEDDGEKVFHNRGKSDDLAQVLIRAHYLIKNGQNAFGNQIIPMRGRNGKIMHPSNFNTVPRGRRPGRFIRWRHF